MSAMLGSLRHLVAAASTQLSYQLGLTKAGERPPVPRALGVDLTRYAGPWFIIGAIPLPIVESGAHNPVESYGPASADGRIEVTFLLRKNGFNGKLKIYRTHAVADSTSQNAVWRVQTLRPLMQQYVIAHLEADYSAAIVARDARDHVWILSRTPTLDDNRLAAYRARIVSMGYNLSEFRFYPQSGSMPG